MLLPLALTLLACSPAPPPPDAPALQKEPSAAIEPAPEPPPPAAAPEHLSAVYEISARAGSYESDIGAQRIALDSGARQWTEGHQRMIAASAALERRPVAVSDGEGGFIAVFEAEVPQGPMKGDLDLLAQRVGSDGTPRWFEGARSALVATTPVVERAPKLLADGAGGAFLVFERLGGAEDGSLDSDLAAQRIDREGRLLWAAGAQAGVPLDHGPGLVSDAAICPDGRGGLVVAYRREPTSGPHAGIQQIWAQRLDASGQARWGVDGTPVPVAISTGALGAPSLLPSSDGGALVFFQEEVTHGEHVGDQDLMVQRLSPDGSLPWSGEPEAYKVVSATALAEGPPAVVSDGADGAIVAYAATWLEGPRKGEPDLFAQRIGPDGLGLWNDGAPVVLASSPIIEGDPQLVSDAAGGAIAVFEQRPPAAHLSNDQDLGAQRLSADGALLWHEGERSAVLSATTHREQTFDTVSDGAGGVVVVFEVVAREDDRAGDAELAIQRLDADGQRLWGEDGAPLPLAWSAAMEQHPVLVVP